MGLITNFVCFTHIPTHTQQEKKINIGKKKHTAALQLGLKPNKTV